MLSKGWKTMQAGVCGLGRAPRVYCAGAKTKLLPAALTFLPSGSPLVVLSAAIGFPITFG